MATETIQVKHTPGPWFALNYAGYWCIQSKEGYIENGDLLNAEHTEDAEANAKLIAAAPQLLESLKEIMLELDIPEWIQNNLNKQGAEIMQRAKAAIKKATD